MNRIPRRPVAVRSPLRGRLAAELASSRDSVHRVVRQRPPISGGLALRERVKTECDDLHPGFYSFYQQWRFLFEILNRPWKWGLAIALGLFLAFLLGLLL